LNTLAAVARGNSEDQRLRQCSGRRAMARRLTMRCSHHETWLELDHAAEPPSVSPVGSSSGSADVKIPQHPSNCYCRFAGEGGQKLLGAAHENQPLDCPVFKVEVNPFGWKYGCTSFRPAVSFAQAGRFLVVGDPEALHVARDERCRNRLVDDGGIRGAEIAQSILRTNQSAERLGPFSAIAFRRRANRVYGSL
jgi:hypothetical protein